MKPTKPIYQSVVDLGLRDVGLRNDPRRFFGQLGKATLAGFALLFVSLVALCAFLAVTGVGAWVVGPVLLLLVTAGVVLMLRAMKRTAPLVVKVRAEGTNQATWLLVIPQLLSLAACVVLLWDLRLIPVVALAGLVVVLAWRGRGRLPEALRELRVQLGENETVIGDGVGMARDARTRRDAARLVVATDRRVLVTRSPRADGPLVVLDAPYAEVTRFGIEWRLRGRVGVLELTAPGDDGQPHTHTVGSIAPLNLLSIARALASHGVATDDPDVLVEAERTWEETQRGEAVKPILDRAAMSTGAFDRGLWLLVAVSAVLFHVVTIGLWASVALVGAVCVLCGYWSGTRSALAYLLPLNLIMAPAIFYANASIVILLMLFVSAVAGAGLWAGAALRHRSPGTPEQRTGLRHAVSGLSLVRTSGGLLAALLALIVIGALLGFEPRTLGLAISEVTAKELPADGRSNLTGDAASLSYTPGPGLREFIKDEHFDAGPNDGARWELRTSVSRGDNVVSLAHYIFADPWLDSPAAIADFVADKDDEHSRIARRRVTHTTRVVDGRTGYVWTHESGGGYWHHVAWFPAPVHSIRIECVSNRQVERFKRLCAEAMRTLEFH
jgi:hypothetical protein